MTTLIGGAIAGGLIWLASWMGMDSNAEYWAFAGLLAGAGLVMALSQLVGGWTKWGRPVASPTVFGVAFLPALIAGGWVLVMAQPNGNGPRNTTRDWLADIGLFESVGEVLLGVAPVIAFGLGLVFGFVFDTTGPRRREEIVEEEPYAAEEPVAAEREHVSDREPAHPVTDREPATVGADRERVTGPGTPVAPQPEPEARPRRRFLRR